jgi:hypothetical protein
MENNVSKPLSESLRILAVILKRCRAADQIVQGYVRLNSSASSDGLAAAFVELQSAADEMVKHARQYAKTVGDLAAAVNTSISAGETQK